MKVTVLQGINLESPITKIKFTCERDPKSDIIEMVKGFHPVFLEDYTISGKDVEIRSKLPKLWKEIAVAIDNEAKGDWTMEFAQRYVKEIILTKQIKSMSTIPILQAAHNMGLETILTFVDEGIKEEAVNRYYTIGVGHESATTLSVGSTKDTSIGRTIQRDKILTNILIERLNLPIAKWAKITSEDHLKELFDSFNKPVVIKPTGLVGGKGVSTKIETKEQAVKAYKFAKDTVDSKPRNEWQKSIMMQEQVEGEDYRILVINGKMEIATKRIPAFVTGDGLSTVQELIEKENNDPKRDVSNPAHILKPIQIDDPLKDLLKEQGKNLTYTASKGEVIPLRKEASMSRGGITKDFTDKVNPQIRYIVETLAETLKIYVLGVDIICKDISKPLTNDNGSIIECNMMPEAFLNFFPVIGKQYPQAGETIVKGLVNTENPTKKLVFLGGELNKINSILKMQLETYKTEKIGTYSNGSTFINEVKIAANSPTAKAVEALKLNGSVTTIALHYETRKEIEENGLGFDSIDKIIIDSKFAQENEDIVSTLEGYQNLGIPYEIKIV